MHRSLFRSVCLAALLGCAAAEQGGDDDDGDDAPLKPQPEPEHFVELGLNPDRIRFARSANRLTVTGDPGSVKTLGSQLVVTEVRPGAPVLEVPLADDGSFQAELTSTGATSVQVSPVRGNDVGSGAVFVIDEAGGATRSAPTCLLGTSGLWQVGTIFERPSTIESSLRLINQCDGAISIDRFALRTGTEFSLGGPTFPTTLAAGENLVVPVRFALLAGESPRGPARYDFVDIASTPGVGGGGFVLRVTREPPPKP